MSLIKFTAARCRMPAAYMIAAMFATGAGLAQAQNVDLVVTIDSDQPAYMAQDLEHFEVTISNNGPDTATNVELVIDHPVADVPFETSATCQSLAGPNPNGPAICPPGSGTAPSPVFVRSGSTFSITVPAIPSQSQLLVSFDNFARCPEMDDHAAGAEPPCFGLPVGNYTVSANVSSPENDTNPVTSNATTNIFLYPPDVQYRIEITSAPATALPGDIVEYEFEVSSFGLHPSDALKLKSEIRGLAGNMTPMSLANSPYGAMASTLPGTELLAIDCVSMSIGGYAPSEVFPSLPAAWQTCPSSGLIPIPQPTSLSNNTPVKGFPFSNFVSNLPGTLDGTPSGSVMRFRATVEIGQPACTAAPESGNRELEFAVNVSGLMGTDVVPPGMLDNSDTAVTQVPASCKVADIEFTTSANPSTISLDNNGNGDWTQITTVSNLSTGPTADTAINVPVEFGHYSYAFTETQSAVTCTSSPSGLCPTPAEMAAGVVLSNNTAFKFATTIASLPPGASLTFTQQLTETRTECWGSNQALISLSGKAGPSPSAFDPIFSATTPPQPPDFTPGSNVYFGNNGMQTIATVGNLPTCPGGGTNVDIDIKKTGPFASAADAASNGPLIGQTPATAIADNTQVFYKIEVTNPDSANPVLLDAITDFSFSVAGLAPVTSGFVYSGSSLPNWGIACSATPASAACHEIATSWTSSGYNNNFSLSYDPQLHGGDTQVPLAPLASLTYIVPFTTPTHLDHCYTPKKVSNQAAAKYANAADQTATTPMSIVDYYIGNPPCSSGDLEIEKEILAPADMNSIPTSGLISYRLTLSNVSPTETLDIAHLVDTPSAFGADLEVNNIVCNTLSGGAQCPTTPIIPGIKTPATGAPSPLPNVYQIDHEWGEIGNNTFPPNSSLEFIVTFKLSNPTRQFYCMSNRARFSGENDPNGWRPDEASTSVCPPQTPELSLQKKVTPQIAAPGSLVTWTLIVTNIGSADADGTVLFDPLPAALLASNPGGYINVSCTDISASGFIPNPQGTAVCPSITSDSSGLSATISTLGANTALEFTYQALMPDIPTAPVSIENIATVTPASPSGLSFGAGSAQSHQNVQVTDQQLTGQPSDTVAIPVMGRWALIGMALAMLMFGAQRLRAWRG